MLPGRRAALIRWTRLVVVMVALIYPWPLLPRAYTATFGAIATRTARPFFRSSGVDLTFDAWPTADPSHAWFVLIAVRDALTHERVHAGAADLRRAGYLQTASFLALAAAFPLRNRRRYAIALVAGAALFPMMGWLPILMYLATKRVVAVSHSLVSILSVVYDSLVAAPSMAYAVPALLWLVIAWGEWPFGLRIPGFSPASRTSG